MGLEIEGGSDIEHKEERQVIFHNAIDLLISNIIKNNSKKILVPWESVKVNNK